MKKYFRFIAFNPSQKMAIAAEMALRRIILALPTLSEVDAQILKIGSSYRCQIDLQSLQGRYRADALEPSPMGALLSALDQVRKHLSLFIIPLR